MASGYLDWIFDSLQQTKKGVFSDTTYYDAMFDKFDRADEIRMIRDGTMRYRGRDSARETRRQVKEAQRQAEEKARRKEIDLEADLTGKWIKNKAEPYEIPATPRNIFLAKLEIRRLEEKQAGQLLPVEKIQGVTITQLEGVLSVEIRYIAGRTRQPQSLSVPIGLECTGKLLRFIPMAAFY
ncbi:hypothetical protein [Desulfallas thermosapovorans]|uniref:Uncharacterized protein n=1 Tax=Desulfallas thermosapovorans DSM 6562 TaxID=1121431 RepID=A0A5S4ZQX6_9FIRM|nr:hypothetical protein [Desulfallas thermosapovorans]TYO94472.1 hypothetical protein LX24_02459 [Desulfallas thermosapovorans DSM 6562]